MGVSELRKYKLLRVRPSTDDSRKLRRGLEALGVLRHGLLQLLHVRSAEITELLAAAARLDQLVQCLPARVWLTALVTVLAVEGALHAVLQRGFLHCVPPLLPIHSGGLAVPRAQKLIGHGQHGCLL